MPMETAHAAKPLAAVSQLFSEKPGCHSASRPAQDPVAWRQMTLYRIWESQNM